MTVSTLTEQEKARLCSDALKAAHIFPMSEIYEDALRMLADYMDEHLGAASRYMIPQLLRHKIFGWLGKRRVHEMIKYAEEKERASRRKR